MQPRSGSADHRGSGDSASARRSGNGASCASSPVTEGLWGEARARHLAEYVDADSSACGHRNIATRTVDSYARMILWFGGSFLKHLHALRGDRCGRRLPVLVQSIVDRARAARGLPRVDVWED